MTKEYLCIVSSNFEACASRKIVEYIDHYNYGHEEEAERSWNEYLLVRSSIDQLKNYIVNPVLDYSKVRRSLYGRFYLKDSQNDVSLTGTLKLNPDDINCISEDMLCDIINKLNSICNC